MQPTKPQPLINSLQFENSTTLKIELNRPARMNKKELARYIFKQLQNLD